MEFKTYLTVEIEKNGKKTIISLPAGSSFKDCYDSLHEVAEELVRQNNEAVERAKKEEEAKLEPITVAVEEPAKE
jgi:hypothetical protein